MRLLPPSQGVRSFERTQHSHSRNETWRAREKREWRNDRALFVYRNPFSEQIELIKIEEVEAKNQRVRKFVSSSLAMFSKP
jgi:hypothetical protein